MRIRPLAVVTAALTFVLMVLGSLVHGTGSSLACPDWPLCNGQVFPAMTGGVEFEHSHRLVALLVVVLIATMFVQARRLHRPSLARLAGAALALVGMQALLGAATVILRLPPLISIAHLATSALVLSTLILFAFKAGPSITAHAHETSRVEVQKRRWAGVAAAFAIAQAVAGAAVRHTSAALACTGFPLCSGQLWPEGALPQLHMAHRAGALLVTALVITAWGVGRKRAQDPADRFLALAPCVVLTVQIVLGAAVVLEMAPLLFVTLHHATGVLLVGVLVARWGALRARSEAAATTVLRPTATA